MEITEIQYEGNSDNNNNNNNNNKLKNNTINDNYDNNDQTLLLALQKKIFLVNVFRYFICCIEKDSIVNVLVNLDK